MAEHELPLKIVFQRVEFVLLENSFPSGGPVTSVDIILM